MATGTWRRRRRWVLKAMVGTVLSPVFALTGYGQEDGPKLNSKDAEPKNDDRRRRERWKRVMSEYTIVARSGPEPALRLRTEPVLHWSNPVRDSDDGLVFLWLDAGRPRAVICYYRAPWQGRMLETHEFQSLSIDGLTATRNGQRVWQTSSAGVVWAPVPGASPPAATPAERLRQLRTMAREFRGAVDVDKKRTELRLLSQPVYRYESTDPDTVDGALFSFALTTDPEAWLLIEDRPGREGRAWHFAFARMTSHSLSFEHRGRTVWEVAHEPDYTNPTGTYFASWSPAPVPEP